MSLTKYQDRRAFLWALHRLDRFHSGELCLQMGYAACRMLADWIGVDLKEILDWDGRELYVPNGSVGTDPKRRNRILMQLKGMHGLLIDGCSDPTEGRGLSPEQERKALEWIVRRDEEVAASGKEWEGITESRQEISRITGVDCKILQSWDDQLQVLPGRRCSVGNFFVQNAVRRLREEHGVVVLGGPVAVDNVTEVSTGYQDLDLPCTEGAPVPDYTAICVVAVSGSPQPTKLEANVEEKLAQLEAIWQASRWAGPMPVDVVRARARVALALGCPVEWRGAIEQMPDEIDWESPLNVYGAHTRDIEWLVHNGEWRNLYVWKEQWKGPVDYTKALRALDEQLAILCREPEARSAPEPVVKAHPWKDRLYPYSTCEEGPEGWGEDDDI